MEMSVENRKRVSVSIRNNVDGDLEGPYVVYLGEGEALCAVLEGYRAVAEWYSVRSVNLDTSPPLNWSVAGHAAEETRAAVRTWEQSVLAGLTRDHRLTLTTNAENVENAERVERERAAVGRCVARVDPARPGRKQERLTTETAGGRAMTEMRGMLRRMNGLSFLGMRQEIIDWRRNAESGGYTVADSWALSGGNKRRVCGDMQVIIKFFEENPGWRDGTHVDDLKSSLKYVEQDNEVGEFCLETLLDVKDAMPRKKVEGRRAEWERVERLILNLIRDAKAGMTDGHRVPLRPSKP